MSKLDAIENVIREMIKFIEMFDYRLIQTMGYYLVVSDAGLFPDCRKIRMDSDLRPSREMYLALQQGVQNIIESENYFYY